MKIISKRYIPNRINPNGIIFVMKISLPNIYYIYYIIKIIIINIIDLID